MENFDTEKIEEYLKGQLSPSEQKIIVDRMATEPAFAEAVTLHQISIAGIEQFGLQQIQANIRTLDTDLEQDGFFLTMDDLDAYLDKKADVATQKTIEQRLLKDEVFKKDFELHQLTRAGIEKKEIEDEFTGLFNDLDKDLAQEGFFNKLDTKKESISSKENKEAKIVRFPFQRLAIAASVALVIFASWWVFQSTPPNSQMIYASNFSPLTDELSIELEETGFVKEPFYDLLEEGMEAYNNTIVPINSNTSISENYLEAIDFFKRYRQAAPTTDDFYPSATLYLAISHLAIEEFLQAIPLLEKLTQQNFPQKVDAQWYLALSYIKTGQTEKAIPILKTLEQTKYQESATTIIRELE